MAVDDLTRDLKEMMRLAAQEDGLEALLNYGLNWVHRITPYDLTTIFLLEGDELVVRAARGELLSEAVRNHKLSIKQFPSIREVLDSKRARAFTDHDHSDGDGDPFDDVLDLPHGHGCLVVPLVAGGQQLGILTLDRAYCQPYDQETVDLLEIYGQVLSMTILLAQQNMQLRRLHDDALARERLLADELQGDPSNELGNSRAPVMKETLKAARQAAPTETPILILGETGTGKERMANAIHKWSNRKDQPFVKINCAAIPENLLESELFGHVKGAFTGAAKDRSGRFQMANGGTLLLDEIGEMPLALQAKLLRVLQEGTLEPVGSDRTVKVDVRILASTHVDLKRAIADKRFREDLYYRLAVFPITMPPLRARLEDLPLLCAALLQDLGKRTGRGGYRVSEAGLAHLQSYHWPGNVRELGNLLERALILSPSRDIGPEALDIREPGAVQSTSPSANRPAAGSVAEDGDQTLATNERLHIEKILRQTEGKIYGDDGAAKILGLKPSTLQSRMKKLGVTRT